MENKEKEGAKMNVVLRKKLHQKFFTFLLVLAMTFSMPFQLPALSTEVQAEETKTISVSPEIQGTDCISKYGNISLDLTVSDFLNAGFEYGDVVRVVLPDRALELPVCSSYSDVDSGEAGLFASTSGQYIQLAINMGNFAETYGIATKTTNADKTYFWTAKTGITFPLKIYISMQTKADYYDEYIMHSISYTDNRTDYNGSNSLYPALTDEQFANFRNVATTGMGKNLLYRGASPVNPKHSRNTYADAAIKKAGVTVVMNLADSETALKSYTGYADTYYARTKHIALNLSVDTGAADFKKGLGEGLKFFAANPGVYFVHCTEGKDRAGFACAIMEAFMGASAKEIVADYMTSYYNYYGITSSDSRYSTIAGGNIVKSLQNAFGISDLYSANLQTCAEKYIKEAGLTDEEITELRANLMGDDHSQTVIRNKKSATYLKTGYSGDTYCSICGKLIKKGKTVAKLSQKTQKITVSKKASGTVYLTYKKLKKKAVSFKISAKAKGTITYKQTYGSKKYLTISKSGKVKLKKGAKRGTYKVTVYAAATKDGKYKKATKVIKIIVR